MLIVGVLILIAIGIMVITIRIKKIQQKKLEISIQSALNLVKDSVKNGLITDLDYSENGINDRANRAMMKMNGRTNYSNDKIAEFRSMQMQENRNAYEKQIIKEKEDAEKISKHASRTEALIKTISYADSEDVVDIEGNSYKTVRIGHQTWMIDDLKTTKYNDGEMIEQGKYRKQDYIPRKTFLNADSEREYMSLPDDEKEISEWHPDMKRGIVWNPSTVISINENSTVNFIFDDANEQSGFHYNWYAVKTGKLAPIGWHVPTKNEWEELFKECGGIDDCITFLKSKSQWNGNNASGINIKPNTSTKCYQKGFHSDNHGKLQQKENVAIFRLSGESQGIVTFGEESEPPRFGMHLKTYGFCVRCIKNDETIPSFTEDAINSNDQEKNNYLNHNGETWSPYGMKLTYEVLEMTKIIDIVYAEISTLGAMGNAGGIIIYTFRKDQSKLLRYEMNFDENPELYDIASESLFDEFSKAEFMHNYDGMGNFAYINKSYNLEPNENHFTFTKDSVEFHVSPSVLGVFNSIKYQLYSNHSDDNL